MIFSSVIWRYVYWMLFSSKISYRISCKLAFNWDGLSCNVDLDGVCTQISWDIGYSYSFWCWCEKSYVFWDGILVWMIFRILILCRGRFVVSCVFRSCGGCSVLFWWTLCRILCKYVFLLFRQEIQCLFIAFPSFVDKY